MVKSFGDTWQHVVDTLKAEAATLGVSAASIQAGDRTTPAITPSLTVYLIPVNAKSSEAARLSGYRAQVIVFACVAPALTLFESISNAVDLAGRVVQVLSTIPEVMLSDNPLEFDEDNADYTCISVQGFVRYQL